MNWNESILDYSHYLKIERGLSSHTIQNYIRDVKKLISFINKKKITCTPIDINEDLIQQFIYEIAKEISPRSQARIISGLRSFFDYLKIGVKLPDTLSELEINSLISAIDLSKVEGERNRAMLETMYSCGLRVSELIDLKISDLFFEEGFIKIVGKGNKERFVPIHSSAQNYIMLYINEIRTQLTIKKGFEDTLFLNRRGKSLSRQMIFMILKALAIKINLNKKISPHTFRHSFATHLLKNGADLRAIQQMLGHESITTTEVYVHLDTSYLKKIVEKYHPIKS
jgi:integrase/recombinase XerD